MSEKENKKTVFLVPAEIRVRAVHYFMDYFIIKLLIIQIYTRLTGISLENLEWEAMMLIAAKVELLWSAYIIIGEFLFQKTVAKIFTKCIVVDLQGKRPGLFAILLRTLLRHIPLEFITWFMLGYFLHDEWSRTAVVYEEEMSEESEFLS